MPSRVARDTSNPESAGRVKDSSGRDCPSLTVGHVTPRTSTSAAVARRRSMSLPSPDHGMYEHVHRLPGDEARVVAGDEDDHGGDVVGLGHAPERAARASV